MSSEYSWLWLHFVLEPLTNMLNTHLHTPRVGNISQCAEIFIHVTSDESYQPYPLKSFTTMVIIFKIMRGSLKNWHACMSPMICPLSEFLAPLWISIKVHPLGARNRSSFSIANEFAKSRKPSSKVHKPIFYIMKESTFHFQDKTLQRNFSFIHKESRCL